MTDAHDQLALATDDLGSRAVVDPAAILERSRAGARRVRVRRHALHAAVSVAATAAIGTTAWLGTVHRPDVVPVHTPTLAPSATASKAPSTTPSPTVSPTPSTTATPAAAQAPSPGLPPSVPLPDGLLRSARPGWVLTVQRPAYFGLGDDQPTVAANAVYLVSPQGVRYHVLDLPLDLDLTLWSWVAGEERAQVFTETGAAWLDLRTGALTPTDIDTGPDPDGFTWSPGHKYGIDEVEVTAGIPQYFVFASPATGGPSIPDLNGRTCWVVAWASESEARLMCVDGPEETGSLYSFDASRPTAPPVLLVGGMSSSDGYPARGGLRLGDGRIVTAVATTPYDDCKAGWMILDGATMTRTDGNGGVEYRFEQVGGTLYVGELYACSAGDGASTTNLVAHDLASGAEIELGGPPDPRDVPAAGAVWVDGLHSWTVGVVG